VMICVLETMCTWIHLSSTNSCLISMQSSSVTTWPITALSVSWTPSPVIRTSLGRCATCLSIVILFFHCKLLLFLHYVTISIVTFRFFFSRFFFFVFFIFPWLCCFSVVVDEPTADSGRWIGLPSHNPRPRQWHDAGQMAVRVPEGSYSRCFSLYFFFFCLLPPFISFFV
jgi:hypothetical protein